MALETLEEIVTAGVTAQASIDKHLALAYKAAEKLTKVTARGIEEGLVQGIAAKKIIGDARAAQGKIAEVASLFAALHEAQTAACVAAGVDLGSVTTAGGITIGGASVLGGTR